MITAIPLTIIPLILFNAIGFSLGDPWATVLFPLRMVSGATWSPTLADLMIVLAIAMLFFETLRSAKPALLESANAISKFPAHLRHRALFCHAARFAR